MASVFNEENLSTLPGDLAIGHTRYSTTGGSGLRNAQPQVIETIDGPLGVAHNGNLVNAHALRRELLERGVGLQTSSDTEVLGQMLVGGSGETIEDRFAELMRRANGAYSLAILTPEAVYAARDPLGLAEIADKLPEQLSAGMRQRLALGCALVATPKLLVLDEPLTNVDPIGARTIKDELRRRAQAGMGVLLSSHMLPLVEELRP